ncbi:KpLE2 phage-like element protein, IS2 insertion element transposase InsAB' [Escherichia coli]|nr:KpLE2 phage-like element protein, IS2 insertion element transposase InsAB' [Escherichia coli]QEF11993.1 KpLE2 phage-like element protein, IS2 insertion element transposase InsAB' [Escherichia coli]
MSGNIGANPATNADLFTACQGVVCYLYSGDVLQIIGYGGIGGVLQCLLVNNLYSRRAFPKVACRTIRGHDERLFVADFCF